MLLNPKFLKYEDVEQKVTIRKNVSGLTPYEITLPKAPKPDKIINFGKKIEDQYFVREEVPGWVWKMTRMANQRGRAGRKKGESSPREDVIKIVEANKDYSNFVAGQWEKKLEGFWIYIRGKPVYVTPKHWHYLNYYYLDDGLPDFRFVDVDYYYWWELFVEAEKWIYGGIEMEMRRDGKSYRGGNSFLFNATSRKNYNVGLQSKTNDDSKDLFQRTFILPWRKLPFFFSPKFDNKNYPVKEINFRDPDASIDYDEDDVFAQLSSDELNSTIEARSTVHTAFDGQKLGGWFCDESGKTEEMLVSDAWRVHKQCLRVRDVIVGKALMTSTVEETTKGGLIEFQKIWEGSDHAPDKLTPLRQTKSGLVRYFKPSFETYVFDQYGWSIIDDPKDYQAKYRKNKGDAFWDKGGKELVDMEINTLTDPEERQKQIHMYPRTIREAFSTNPRECEFNSVNIDSRIYELQFDETEVIEGVLAWENDEKDTRVIFREQKGGRFKFKRKIFEYLLSISNNCQPMQDGRLSPGNKHLGCIGADPYKYNATNQDRRSLGAAMAYMPFNFDLDNDVFNEPDKWLSEDFIFMYGFRHKDKRRFGEDMIMACVFLGMPIFPEINVPSLWDYFTERGYEHFLKYRKLMKRKKHGTGVRMETSKTPGMTTLGDPVKEPMFAMVGTYIDTRCFSCSFIEFLQDCRDVEYSDLNPYDYFVAGAYALYGSKGTKRGNPNTPPPPKSFDGMWDPQEY